jgi:hypothetical protein
MGIKTLAVGILALGLTASSGIAMAKGGHAGKISDGSWEGQWQDDEGGDGGFSVQNLQGTYVLRFSGFQNGSGSNASAPITGLALLTFDGNGNVTGTETINTLLNSGSAGTGAVCSGTLAGTGSATLQLTLNSGSATACGTGPLSDDFNFIISGDRRLAVSSSDNTSTWGGDAISQDD